MTLTIFLSVSAKDKATNRVQSVRIEASTQLSKEEEEKLKTEAVAHAAKEEKRKKELVGNAQFGGTDDLFGGKIVKKAVI